MAYDEHMARLQEQQTRLMKKVEAAKDWQNYIRPASEYTDAEKVAAFDALHEQAESGIRELVGKGWMDEDHRHYLYEAVMEKTLGDKVWRLIRILQG